MCPWEGHRGRLRTEIANRQAEQESKKRGNKRACRTGRKKKLSRVHERVKTNLKKNRSCRLLALLAFLVFRHRRKTVRNANESKKNHPFPFGFLPLPPLPFKQQRKNASLAPFAIPRVRRLSPCVPALLLLGCAFVFHHQVHQGYQCVRKRLKLCSAMRWSGRALADEWVAVEFRGIPTRILTLPCRASYWSRLFI